jgi:hypothetical protein
LEDLFGSLVDIPARGRLYYKQVFLFKKRSKSFFLFLLFFFAALLLCLPMSGSPPQQEDPSDLLQKPADELDEHGAQAEPGEQNTPQLHVSHYNGI